MAWRATLILATRVVSVLLQRQPYVGPGLARSATPASVTSLNLIFRAKRRSTGWITRSAAAVSNITSPRLPNGRIVVLPPTWEVQLKQWFHNMDIADPDETSEVLVQIWNKGGYSCHVSQEEKNFDLEKDAYKTAWLDFGTNCERCHGPASEHVANHSKSRPDGNSARDIVLQTRLDPLRNTMVCAHCHSFRDIYATGYTAGANYYDFYPPVLEFNQPVDRDPSYWPDGRTRRFSNDAFGLWQSECFLKGGVTCVGCHTSPHEVDVEQNPQLRPDANALCTRCHSGIGKAVEAHSHHAVSSTGSSCVECHMPRTVLSIKAQIRDHSMSIPVPENTLRHGIPNACNNCHKDRDAEWSLQQVNKWYRDASRQKLIHRADAFCASARRQSRKHPRLAGHPRETVRRTSGAG
jgi:hypothetical protein